MRLWKSEKYRKWIASLPCAICLNPVETEAAHIRFAEPSVDKQITGIGIKPSDFWITPLCSRCHREQHAAGDERKFWSSARIDPIRLALALFVAWTIDNAAMAERIIVAQRGRL